MNPLPATDGAPTAAAADPCQAFLESLRHRRQSEHSIRSAGYACARLNAFLASSRMDLAEVTPDNLDRFGDSLVAKGLSRMTVNLVLRRVRRLFRWLSETGRIFLDPTANWMPPKAVPPVMAVPTEAQMAVLLAQPDPTTARGVRDRALLETAYSTGARLDELVRLTVGDLDVEGGLVRVMGKGRKERMLPLGREARGRLRQYLAEARPAPPAGRADEGRLWLTKDGRALSGRGIRMMLSRYAKRAGLPPLSPHAVRRACATHMLRRGAHPVQLQLLLGHADPSTLGRYLRLAEHDIRAMHAAGKPGR